MQITVEHARKVLTIVDAGLIKGAGKKPIAGEVCVEQAVCMALGLPHSDNPICVAPVLRVLKIKINDCNWSSNQARAKGLRRLAVAQLGSADHLDEQEFRRRVVDYALRRSTSAALRSAASIQKDQTHKAKLLAAAKRCEEEGTREAAQDARVIARASYAASYASDADRDKSLADYAEDIVQILIDMKAPGCRWLEIC